MPYFCHRNCALKGKISHCVMSTAAPGCIKANVRIICPSPCHALSSVDSIADYNDLYLL